MNYIYIDTSIFETNNFLESERINQILKLSEEGHIQIVLPFITYSEIKNRAAKNIKAAVEKFKNSRNETRVLRNIESIKEQFSAIDETEVVKEFIDKFDKRLAQAKSLIVGYPTVNTKDVFDKYFGNEFPFGKGDKKHEFPDAFALLSIEHWCAENKKKCFVFSSDKDLLNYKSEFLIIVESYSDFLDKTLREIEVQNEREKRLEIVIQLYEDEKGRIEDEIEDWLFSELDDMHAYYRYTHLEVHNVDIEEHEATLKDYQIVSIGDFGVQIEAKTEIRYKVEIEVDDEDTAYYDDEEREWHYLDTTTDVIEQVQTIPVLLLIDIPIAGDEFMDIRISEINNKKDLVLRS